MHPKARVYIAIYAPLGGGWHTALHTAQCWQKNGFEAEVISFFAPEMPAAEHIQTQAIVPASKGFSARFRALRYVHHVASTIRWFWRTKPQHIFVLSPLDLTYLHLLRSLRVVPYFRLNYIAVTHLSAYRKHTPSRETLAFKSLHSKWFLQQALKSLKSCICLTQSTADDLAQNYAPLPAHTAIIPPFLNNRYFETALSPQSTEHSIVYVGRLSAEKNIADLLIAFALLKRKLPKATLTLVGDGPERQHLAETAKVLDIAESVVFAGMQSDVIPFHQQARVTALTSFYEGFPMALAEGLASGLTAVAYNIDSGPKDMITDGENGYLVPVGKTAELANQLEQALRHPFKKETVRTLAQSFAPTSVAQQYTAFLQQYFERA